MPPHARHKLRDLIGLPDGPPVVQALLGPTNTGKTHRAIERMLAHPTGMMGLPLRLLAREVYDRVTARVGEESCALITGEERRIGASARYFICTTEAMPLDREVSFLAIDEIQLAGDRNRGHIFTDRVLHARGTRETLFLGSDTIEPLLLRILPHLLVERRPRLSKLTHAGPMKIGALPKRTAIVDFTAARVVELAERVRARHGGTAVVMGALSPRARNAQVAMYQSGEVSYMVATDAIGMGLNMDIQHVAFAGFSKWDGRQQRRLKPAEAAQIAGRAGRHTQDGTFGTTGEQLPLDEETTRAIEGHSFEPLRQLWFRSSALDFSSLEALRESLWAPPTLGFLERARSEEDELALAALLPRPAVRDRATTPPRVRLLWEVCQVPDFRKLLTHDHEDFLETLYRLLVDKGALPSEWVERQLSFLDRIDGDFDALMGRLAGIRTWTYLTHRPSWLERPQAWQARAREIEDRLSDALHLALTSRFVDRRSLAVVQQPSGLGVSEDGGVWVGRFRVGTLAGVRFTPDPEADSRQERALREGLSALIAERVEALVEAPFSAFHLDDSLRLIWRGGPVATLLGGDRPELKLLRNEWLTPSSALRVQRRLAAWLQDWRAPLQQRVTLSDPLRVTPETRGIFFRVEKGLGMFPRAELPPDQLGPRQRQELARLGVKIGADWVFHPLDASALPVRAALWAAGAGVGAVPPLPGGGESEPRERSAPDAFYLACGYVPWGARALRVDRHEQLAFRLRERLRQGALRIGPEEAALWGGEEAGLKAALAEQGYQERADGVWLSPRRRPR